MAFDPVANPIDYFTLAGERSPGTATIEDSDLASNWDERRGFGTSGAISIYRGFKLAHPVAKIVLTTSQHFTEWASFSAALKRPPPRTRPRAMDIWHPILEDIGIRSVSVENLGQPVQTADGEWTVIVKFIEYRRPRLALARPDGSDGGEAVDPVDAEINALVQQARDLANQ